MTEIIREAARPVVTVMALSPPDAAEVAALAVRLGAASYSDLNKLQPDGSVRLTVRWISVDGPVHAAAHPDGPPEVREFLREMDGWSSAQLAR